MQVTKRRWAAHKVGNEVDEANRKPVAVINMTKTPAKSTLQFAQTSSIIALLSWLPILSKYYRSHNSLLAISAHVLLALTIWIFTGQDAMESIFGPHGSWNRNVFIGCRIHDDWRLTPFDAPHVAYTLRRRPASASSSCATSYSYGNVWLLCPYRFIYFQFKF